VSDPRKVDERSDCGQFSVLVEIREFMENPEGVDLGHLGDGSVRLNGLNVCPFRFRKPGDSWRTAYLKLTRVFEDRELSLAAAPLGIDGVVERGPEIVDGVPDGQWPIVRDSLFADRVAHVCDLFRPARFSLGFEDVSLRFLKGQGLPVDRLSLFYAP